MNNLLQATSAISANTTAGAGTPGLGRSPMLIPISSMNPYEVNLQQLADTMAAGKPVALLNAMLGISNQNTFTWRSVIKTNLENEMFLSKFFYFTLV